MNPWNSSPGKWAHWVVVARFSKVFTKSMERPNSLLRVDMRPAFPTEPKRFPMGPRKIDMGMIAVGSVPELTVKSIAAHVQGYLNLNVDVFQPMEEPRFALDETRSQYDARILLRELASQSKGDEKVLGILDVDLFVPIFTYVFGEAQQGGKCALVSTYRLGGDVEGLSRDDPVVVERAAKVALHETGHLFGLRHCADRTCNMHFSGGLTDLDKTRLYYCRYCALYLHEALRHRSGSGRESG